VGKTGRNPLATQEGPAEKQPPQQDQPGRGGKPGAPEKPVAIGSSESAVGGGRSASDTGEKGAADGFEAEAGGTQAKRGKGLGVSIDPLGGPKVPGGGDGGDGKPKTDLRPSGDALAKVAVGTYDKLDDIDEGDDTLLNTKRFKYASFFNRVKRAVWENWHADRVYSIRDPDGRIYGIKDRLTVLKVSLRADGSLANVIIEKPPRRRGGQRLQEGPAVPQPAQGPGGRGVEAHHLPLRLHARDPGPSELEDRPLPIK
jgi:hypothetical protein